MDLASIKKFFASLTLQKLVPVILIVVIGLLLVKLLLKLFDRVLERSRLERTMFSFLRAVMRALLYTILVLVAASSLGVDVTSLVAILSVVSLAISLAVQNALSNVVGSVTLLTTHPFHVGDFVEIGSDSGTVEEISVSYTKLATVDGKRIYIPNSDAASARICNYSVEGRRRVDLYIGVSYDAPAEKVREALLAAAQHPKALQDPPAGRAEQLSGQQHPVPADAVDRKRRLPRRALRCERGRQARAGRPRHRHPLPAARCAL
mgnify:CR=1 FL=1